MSLKNRDYAGDHGNEPFANFTRVEAMGICTTEQGFLTRITDKMSRLSSFIDCGKMHVENESFNDTIVDVINYMVLLSAFPSPLVSSKMAIRPVGLSSSLPSISGM